jgi:hypothetical protein
LADSVNQQSLVDPYQYQATTIDNIYIIHNKVQTYDLTSTKPIFNNQDVSMGLYFYAFETFFTSLAQESP